MRRDTLARRRRRRGKRSEKRCAAAAHRGAVPPWPRLTAVALNFSHVSCEHMNKRFHLLKFTRRSACETPSNENLEKAGAVLPESHSYGPFFEVRCERWNPRARGKPSPARNLRGTHTPSEIGMRGTADNGESRSIAVSSKFGCAMTGGVKALDARS